MNAEYYEEYERPSGHNFENLKAHILERSVAKAWHLAVLEWVPVDFDERPGSTCPCGQHPVVERCHIANTRNENETWVGNVCIKRFMAGAEALSYVPAALACLKRIKKTPWAAPSKALVLLTKGRGILSQREATFLLETARKRSMTPRQMRWRRQLNRKLVGGLTRIPELETQR